MQAANVSPWVNKWQEVFDFTAHKTVDSETPNWFINDALVWDLVQPLGEVDEIFTKISQFKDNIRGFQDIEQDDIDQIQIEFNEEESIMPHLFDVGPYFNTYASNIIKGVVPSAQFKRKKMDYKDSLLLVAFVRDFDAIFDSTNAVLDHEGIGPVDLRNTLQYKLLITCGSFIKVNKRLKQQKVWIEDTRSVILDADQKNEFCYILEADEEVADDGNLMAIAIEFRLKSLVSANSVAGQT